MQFAWDVVNGKLVDSLSAIKNGVNLSERVHEIEKKSADQPSSLSALSEGPRIRLLWASFQWLNKEAGTLCIVALNLFHYIHHIVRRSGIFFYSHILGIQPMLFFGCLFRF